MHATQLPGHSVLGALEDGVFSTRTRRIEFCLLSALSLLTTIATISVFGTHINTWLGTLSIVAASR